jgi:DNA-binding CsgD family transcriptional regulator
VEQPPVVGRRRELEVFEHFLAHPPASAAALALRGPAGIGKTTVWQAGVDLAIADGWRTLAAAPAGAEASLAFAGLVDLFATVDDEVLDRLPVPQRRALAAALLREDPLDGRVDSRAVATAVSTVLQELAGASPTLLAVDDAQYLDQATADALRFAVRRLRSSPIAILCSIRTAPGRPDTFETALPETQRFELDLTPLSVAALHEIVRRRLGRSLPRPTLVRVAERARGNAFYALEIARELVRRGGDDAGEPPVPESVQELVRARIARLPADTRDALLLASALAVPTTSFVPADLLAPAEEDGVVRIHVDGRIHFDHPLLAAAVYSSAPVSRRRSAHLRLVDLADDVETRARHLALAADAPDEAVAVELDAAAAYTAARGSAAAAAELAQLALERTPPGADDARVVRALATARHLLDAGDSEAARVVLEGCDPSAVDGDLRARLLLELGSLLGYEGERAAGIRLVEAALQEASDPKLVARAHAAAAWLLQEGEVDRAIEHSDAAVALLDPDEQPGPYSSSLLFATYLRLLNGEGSDEDTYRRGLELQRRPIAWEDTSPVVGMWPIYHDRFAEGRRFYEIGLERARAEGDVTTVQASLLRLAELACWTGDWGDADRLAEEGVALADRTASSAFLGSALYARAIVDAHLGRLDEARTAAVEIAATFGATGQGALGRWVLGFVALSAGDAVRADAEYAAAQAIVDGLGLREPARFRFQPDHLEAVVELGDLARARALLDRLDARATAFPRPWILAVAGRCHGLVLAAEGELEAAAAALDESLRCHEDLAMPFERARTLLVDGRTLRRLKQKRRARAALDEATAIFEALGAARWVVTAHAELARLASRRAPDELTPTERQIAELAATGLSNPEIAARIYVSRKTVEANLGRIYRKLGISSRAQLGRALQQIS